MTRLRALFYPAIAKRQPLLDFQIDLLRVLYMGEINSPYFVVIKYARNLYVLYVL